VTTDPFPPAGNLATARRLASADMKHQINLTEMTWLQDHKLLWLRALTVMQREAENHIAKDRMDMNAYKPTNGADATVEQAEWIRLKGQLDQRTKHRLHFIQKVKARKEEVKGLIGAASAVELMLVGDVIAHMFDLADLAAAGEFENVQAKALHLAERWAAAYGGNSQTDACKGVLR
jgi:hypothetical protein